LQSFIVETMREEWEFGNNIASPEALKRVALRCGLDPEQTIEASGNPDNLAQLEANAERADRKGVIGVPSFVIGEEIFWGQDRVDFVIEALTEQRARRI
jgi:2-hydroxychromene-2-carboxylate isomerase